MFRIKLIVAYDGTDYVGWQYQPNGISVQQRLEEAIERLTGIVHRVHSSGRTDAGVHARGMVCHVTSAKDLPLSAWSDGINSYLPQTIAVRQAEFVDEQFHARFSARGKHYRYTILRDTVRSPCDRLTSWRVKQVLALEQMKTAAKFFIGKHDFSGFRTSGCAAGTTTREIFAIEFSEHNNLLHIDIYGSGFLKNMVRMMIGTLTEIGLGKRPASDIQMLLIEPSSVAPALTAPAHGLCLMEVMY